MHWKLFKVFVYKPSVRFGYIIFIPDIIVIDVCFKFQILNVLLKIYEALMNKYTGKSHCFKFINKKMCTLTFGSCLKNTSKAFFCTKKDNLSKNNLSI